MTVAEIESAISRLPAAELAELISWLKERYAQLWDVQIETDLDSGRLDSLLDEVEKEYQAIR
jgi:hypothetical protein